VPNIFVSYRRDDSAAGYVISLRDRLAQRFGPEAAFLDIERIAYGDDCAQVIKTQIGTSQACLVWIGREWMTCQNELGQRRLDDPQDVVRLEVATALQRQIRVIPVLVGGARPPKVGDLPEGPRALAGLNAIDVSHARFDRDLDYLMEVLERN
jgi:hypothetical protein